MQEIKGILGLGEFYIAPLVKKDTGYIYEKPEQFSGSREIAIEPVGGASVIRADNIDYISASYNGGYTGTLTVCRILDKFKLDLLGFEQDTTDKMIYETSEIKELPKFALIVRLLGSENSINPIWTFYNVSITNRPSLTYSVIDDPASLSIQYEQLPITCAPHPLTGMTVSMSMADTPKTVYENLIKSVWQPSPANPFKE